MYLVTLYNEGLPTEVHNGKHKLLDGKVVRGINTIDSFTFTIAPKNPGYNALREFATIVEVYNDVKDRYEFQGRVLRVKDTMDESGAIDKEVTCESFLGYLCDSRQLYVAERNWAVRELLEYIVGVHNEQVGEDQKFQVGDVTVTDPNDNLYCGIQTANSLDAIKEKLIDVLGGELRVRKVDGVLYLDYLTKLGEDRSTEIALSRNMRAITRDIDPLTYVTRLIPLGAKLQQERKTVDSEGNVTNEVVTLEERLDISAVNGGKKYIDDVEAIRQYRIHVEVVEWDDVTDATNLLRKGQEWLVENNRVPVKYSITALDLSLLGLDMDDFNVCDTYPIKNSILGIDDRARIIKKTVNICDVVESTFEIGDNFKTLSDLQREQKFELATIAKTIESVEANYVTNEQLRDESRSLASLIKQTTGEITLGVSGAYTSKTEFESYKSSMETKLSILKDEILMIFNTSEETQSKLNGEFSTSFTEIYSYISFAGGEITLSGTDSALTLKVAKEGIIFSENGVQKGLWDGTDFYTGNIVVRVTERAQFGNFAFVPRSDGSLMLLKVGGE